MRSAVRHPADEAVAPNLTRQMVISRHLSIKLTQYAMFQTSDARAKVVVHWVIIRGDSGVRDWISPGVGARAYTQ
jgi:hypothetical protein